MNNQPMNTPEARISPLKWGERQDRPAGYFKLYMLKKDETMNVAEERCDIAGDLLMNMEKWWRAELGGEPDPLVVQPISLPVP